MVPGVLVPLSSGSVLFGDKRGCVQGAQGMPGPRAWPAARRESLGYIDDAVTPLVPSVNVDAVSGASGRAGRPCAASGMC